MRKKVLIPTLALLAVATGFFAWRHARSTDARIRVLLLDCESSPTLSSAEAQVLNLLISDELEIRGDLAVTQLPSLPQPFQPEGALLLIRPRASREGTDLRLDLAWAKMGPGQDGAWHQTAVPVQAPASAIAASLDALPVTMNPVHAELLPDNPGVFWTLVKAESAAFTNVDLEGAFAQAQIAAQQEPGSAALQAALAQLDTVRMLQDPHLLDGHADEALQAANRALALEPGYPRALRYASRLLSDEGRQDEALVQVREGLRLHPHSLTLLFAVDYAARTAGLLDIALAARKRMESLWAGSPVPPPTGFTYLYAGQQEAFEASFNRLPGATPNGFTAFNRGYAALLRGDPSKAATAFQITAQDLTTETQFRALARVFSFQIAGQSADAKLALDALERSRLGLQVPDGEFTFTMAEAAAFLGEEGLAMDLAQQASGQGFLCSAWYKNSPFLTKLQPLPRWQAILQHVEARRDRLAKRHAPADFGL